MASMTTILALIVQYGIPGAIQIFTWAMAISQKGAITEEDLVVLRDIKPPDSFFTAIPTINTPQG